MEKIEIGQPSLSKVGLNIPRFSLPRDSRTFTLSKRLYKMAATATATASALSVTVLATAFAFATLKHTGAFRKNATGCDNITACGITAVTTCGVVAVASVCPPFSIPAAITAATVYAYTPEIARLM